MRDLQLLLVLFVGARGMLMQPKNPRTSNWDTWLFINESHINYFYLEGTDCTPSCLNHIHGWNGVGLATSTVEDMQFTDMGTVLQADTPTQDKQWLGSGSVYRTALLPSIMRSHEPSLRTPNASLEAVGAPYIMAYSQGPGAGTHPATANESQKIYFATSHDLNTWTKTSAVFETDTSLYTVAEGAWDCLATIHASAAATATAAAATPPTKSSTKSMMAVDKRHGIITAVSGTPTAALEKDNAAAVDDESLYGYFFARSKANNGGGFAHSRDGIHWTALQSVHSQPASSVFQFEDRIWLTAVITLAGPAKSPLGPFGNGGSINDGGRLVSMGFLRAWTINAALVLLTHQHVDNGINGASSYIGVIKQVKDDPDQVPRCWWWPQNNALYGRDLYLTQQPAPNDFLSSVEDFDSVAGVVVEVIGGAGVFIETSVAGAATPTLTALLFAAKSKGGYLGSKLNATEAPRLANKGGRQGTRANANTGGGHTAAAVRGVQDDSDADADAGCFMWGTVATVSPLTLQPNPHVVCRGLPAVEDAPFHFRVLLRNHKSRAAQGATADTDALLLEYYVNDVLGDTITMSGKQATGKVGAAEGTVQAFSAKFS